MKRIWGRRRMYGELTEEIRAHIEQKVEELVAGGLSRGDAEAAARREFGNVTLAEEEGRAVWRWMAVENLFSDVRYGIRGLRKSRGFTFVVILTLALGIGANTAIFSYVNAWLIKPLPYPRADRLMVLLSHDTKKGWRSKDVTSTADFLDYTKQSASFEQLTCWSSWYFNLTSDGAPDRVEGGLVGWNFFQTLGVRPILGRTFSRQETEPGSSHVAILSRGLWQGRFGGDPQIIGRTIKLHGEAYTVVGVMSGDFQFPLMGAANLWTPLALDDQQKADRHRSWFQAFGRLKDGVTQQQAAAELGTIAARLGKLYPQTNTNLTILPSPMTYEIGRNEGAEQILMDFWIVGLVLLIACVNVANLMLARAVRRRKEFAVRGALGASRGRMVRQFLTESLLLFAAGGMAGALFAAWGLHWIEAAIPEHIRGFLVNYGRVDLDLTTFAYTFGIALLCGIVFGLVPAFESTGMDFTRALKESGGRVSGSRGAARLRRVFVGAEISLAVVVLISTALLAESLGRMVYGGMGFQPQNVMVTQLVVPPNKYSSDAQIRSFYDRVLERIRTLPEVASTAAGEYVPFSDSNQTERIHVVGSPVLPADQEPRGQYSAVTPDYFSAMRIPLLRGRAIEAGDGAGAANVAVVSEALVRAQFPQEDPIGRQIEIPLRQQSWTIVGVVQDVKQFTLSDAPEPQFYVSAAQFPSGYMSVVARSTRPAPELAAAMREAIWSVDKEQPVSKVQPLDELITEQNTLMRVTTQVIGFFGVLALLLGTVGIYGVMAHAVGQRTQEIGIRVALGASRAKVLRLILSQGLKLTAAGVVCGVLGAAAATQALSAMLYGVRASDPATFALVAVFFAAVALAACYLPARRASRVDPMVALRYE